MANNTYTVKSFHTQDNHEVVRGYGRTYVEALCELAEMRKVWEEISGLEIITTRGRVEAHGATYSIAIYFEKE
jgi:hypothetical protein